MFQLCSTSYLVKQNINKIEPQRKHATLNTSNLSGKGEICIKLSNH
jgi:hypothetical protein